MNYIPNKRQNYNVANYKWAVNDDNDNKFMNGQDNGIPGLPDVANRMTVQTRDINSSIRAVELPTRQIINSSANNNSRPRAAIESTTSSSKVLQSTSSNNEQIYIAISEGRGKASGEIGMAAIDINHPIFMICQFSDNCWYTGTLMKLNILQPVKILLSHTMLQLGNDVKLVKSIKSMFPNANLHGVPRQHFNVTSANQFLEKYCSIDEESIKMAISQKYYALLSVSAIVHYLCNGLNIRFGEKSLLIEYETMDGRTLIDIESSHRLELLYPLCDTGERNASLYGLLDHCVTRPGKRMLRAKILQPNCDQEAIESIQECVGEIIKNDSLVYELQTNLLNFKDVDKLLRISILIEEEDAFKCSEFMINLILLLKEKLENIPELIQLLEPLGNRKFIEIKEDLKDPSYHKILQEIQKTVATESYKTSSSNQIFQRIYVIRSNVSDILDFHRGVYSNIFQQITENMKNLTDQFGLILRINYTINRGFHFIISTPSNVENFEIPDIFQVLHRKDRNWYVVTTELIEINCRLQVIINEIHLITIRLLKSLFGLFRQSIEPIYNLVGLITRLDRILALSKVSLNTDYCRPTFGQETRVVNGINPYLEFCCKNKSPISGGVIGTPDYCFYVITGPNMGGKTIYLKMIVILQIMAQLGCYVPATSATFRIADKIFTRLGFEDDINRGASSYVLEMREMEYIVKTITPNSLVILDEICRSTNAEDGEQIAYQLCEELLSLYSNVKNRNKATKASLDKRIINVCSPFIYVTTHYHKLTTLTDKYFNVVNLYFDAVEELDEKNETRLKFTHQLKTGVTPISNYGIKLAAQLSFPPSIIQNAKAIVEALQPTENKYLTPLQMERGANSIVSSVINPNPNPNPNERRNVSVAGSCYSNSIDINRDLYDIHAVLASIIRNKGQKTDGEVTNEIQTFIRENVSEQLMLRIQNPNNRNTVQLVEPQLPLPQIQPFQGWSELSYNSILRRLKEQDGTDMGIQRPLPPDNLEDEFDNFINNKYAVVKQTEPVKNDNFQLPSSTVTFDDDLYPNSSSTSIQADTENLPNVRDLYDIYSAQKRKALPKPTCNNINSSQEYVLRKYKSTSTTSNYVSNIQHQSIKYYSKTSSTVSEHGSKRFVNTRNIVINARNVQLSNPVGRNMYGFTDRKQSNSDNDDESGPKRTRHLMDESKLARYKNNRFNQRRNIHDLGQSKLEQRQSQLNPNEMKPCKSTSTSTDTTNTKSVDSLFKIPVRTVVPKSKISVLRGNETNGTDPKKIIILSNVLIKPAVFSDVTEQNEQSCVFDQIYTPPVAWLGDESSYKDLDLENVILPVPMDFK